MNAILVRPINPVVSLYICPPLDRWRRILHLLSYMILAMPVMKTRPHAEPNTRLVILYMCETPRQDDFDL